jgi:catechol 2,3-dioxygenase-like lactoylglutathione lyase family enzyme
MENNLRVNNVYETVLYANDLEQAETFYQEVLGLQLIRKMSVGLAFDCGPGVLLIFDPVKASKPGRDVPSHGPQGDGHIAFGVPLEQMDAWREHLAQAGVAIEKDVNWGGSSQSIYFRDPAGNSLELATPTLWK